MLSTLSVVASLLVLLPAVLAQAPGNLRLRGGLHVNEGRLEIFLNGQWGTICDDSWSIQDADVACKQLGFPGAVKPVPGAFYGVGDGEIWLDEMRCRGDEPSLLACNTEMIGGHDCSHDKDAGVVCLMPDMIRLADGDVPNAGRLEIYHDNLWGSVCRDNFNNTAGTVACQQLGYARLQEYYWGNQTVQGTGNIWLDDISCSSSHVRLSQCNSRGWGVTDCRHSDDISLVCEGVPMEPDGPVVTLTTCTNAILQWRRPAVDNGQYIHRYYIRYRPVDQSDWTYITHDSSLPADPPQLTATIPDLTPATSYEVAIAANNVVGNSSYSRPVTMTTREIVFDPPVIVGVADGGSGILHVSWNYSVNEDCGVSADVHIVEYSDLVNTYHLLVENNNYCTLTGLTVNVHYNISVRVGIATRYGYVLSYPSESTIAVSMPTTKPVVAPKQLSTWTINESAILLSWQCTDEVKIGYIIVCQKHDDPMNYWVRNVTMGCTQLEQGIRSNIVYTCMVASFNNIGNGPFSNRVHTVPQYEALNPIPNTSVLAVTMDSITLAIQQGSHDVPDGYVVTETIGYDVTCQSLSVLSHVAVWGSLVNVTIDKLSPDQEYSCDIIAINKFGTGNTTNVIVTTPSSAPTGTPRGLFISDQVDNLYLHWLPLATDQQHGKIIDYNVSCVAVEEGSDPYDLTLHDTSNAWTVLVSQLGYHPNNNKPINVAMPMFTPFQLLSCRVAGINKNGQGPYKYHVTTVNPPGVTIKVQDLQAVVTINKTIVFQWQPLTNDDITKLAVIGYLLQCDGGSHDDHTWQHTVWDPRLSMATVPAYQFLTSVQYNCTITAFNPMGFGLHSDIVHLQIHGSSSSERWYSKAPVVYILLSLIGVTMVIIILLLSCLCYCTCHRNKPYSGKNEIASSSPNKTVDNNYLQSIQYESLDNLYDKTPPPNNKIQPPSNKLNTSLDDNEQLPAEEEYMQMAPSRSCSHATIKSETLRSCDVKLHQMDFGCQDNQQTTNLHYNSLPNNYSHYDIPLNNSLHSNSITNNYYDTPRSHKLAITK